MSACSKRCAYVQGAGTGLRSPSPREMCNFTTNLEVFLQPEHHHKKGKQHFLPEHVPEGRGTERPHPFLGCAVCPSDPVCVLLCFWSVFSVYLSLGRVKEASESLVETCLLQEPDLISCLQEELSKCFQKR